MNALCEEWTKTETQHLNFDAKNLYVARSGLAQNPI